MIIPQKQRKHLPVICLFQIVVAIMESISIAIIIPFVSILTRGNDVINTSPYSKVCALFGIENTYSLILTCAVIVIIVFIVKNILLVVLRDIQNRFSMSVTRDISIRLLISELNKPYVEISTEDKGEISGKIYNDSEAISYLLMGVVNILAELFTVGLILGFVIYTDVILSVCVLLIGSICMFFITFFIRKRVSEAGFESRDANSATYAGLMTALNGFKEIRYMRKEGYFIDKYSTNYQRKCNAFRKYLFYNLIPERIVEVVFVGSLICYLAYKMRWGIDMSVYISRFSGIIMAAYRLMPSMGKFTDFINQTVYRKPSLDAAYNTIFNYVDRCYISTKNNQSELYNECPPNIKANICIDNITYKYPKGNKYIINNLSLEIYAGDIIGIMGESGTGKSTLIEIIMGLIEIDEGLITVDGKGITEIPEKWSTMLGYVTQEVFLLDDSIRNNVAFGVDNENIDDDEIWRCLSKACLTDFVKELPDGLDTVLGDRGMRFSGGQRQRIAIARSIYRHPDILILDEATSALDNETEAEIMESVEHLKGEMTMIIVAHRLSTLKVCNKVYELQGGRLINRTNNYINDRI